MDMKFLTKLFIIYLMANITAAVFTNNTLLPDTESDDTSSKVLSRTKRFLTFPDGSSFQLVFCTQTHGYLQVGDIVWFGTTAALAWELPTDPILLHFLRKEKGYGAQRRQDSRHVVYLDEDGKVISTVPYKRKPIVNPAFAKRSVEENLERNIPNKFSVKEMHEVQKIRSYLNNLDEKSTEFHRNGRKSLFDKLETFFEGLGWRGKQCVLRMLCESGSAKHEQGTFLEELFRATFTMPQSKKPSSELYKEYDAAHISEGDCATLYPECNEHHRLALDNTSNKE